MNNKNSINEYEKWITSTLQPLVYWIAYKKQLIKNYDLWESSIVAKVIELLYSYINKTKFVIESEVQYKKLFKKNQNNNKDRADIVLLKKSTNKKKSEYYSKRYVMVIEVKRKVNRIEDDLRRLNDLRKDTKFKTTKRKYFLLYVVQNKLHKTFINEQGKLIKQNKSNGKYLKNKLDFNIELKNLRRASQYIKPVFKDVKSEIKKNIEPRVDYKKTNILKIVDKSLTKYRVPKSGFYAFLIEVL